jgi:hypothetical protein
MELSGGNVAKNFFITKPHYNVSGNDPPTPVPIHCIAPWQQGENPPCPKVPGQIIFGHSCTFAVLAFGPEGIRTKSLLQNIAHAYIKHIFNVLGRGGPDLPPQI